MLTNDTEVSFVPMNDLGELEKHFQPMEVRRFAEVVKGYTYFADGDVLCAKITPCFENGKLGVARELKNGVGFGSSEFVVMRPTAELLPEFLYYYLSRDTFRERGAKVMSGAVGHKRVPNEYFEDLTIPLPPLEEQGRIVAVLDQAFAALDSAHAQAEANLDDASRLMQVATDSILTKAAKAAKEVELSEYLIKATYGFTNPMPDADAGPWKVTAKNIVGGRIDYQNARHTTSESFVNDLTEKSRPCIGDVLLTKDGTLGRTAVVDRDDICVNQSVAVLRADERIIPDFLSALLSTTPIQKSLIERAGGTTIKHIYISRVPETLVRIPSIDDQKDALENLAIASSRISLAIEACAAKLTDIAELRQSLLQKAFSGQLT